MAGAGDRAMGRYLEGFVFKESMQITGQRNFFSLFRDFAFPTCSPLTSPPGAIEINGNFLKIKAGLMTKGFLKMEQLKQ